MFQKQVDNGGDEPAIQRITSQVYAVIYADSSQQGYIKTYSIYSDGNISDPIDIESFGTTCEELSVSKIKNNIYAIAYGSDGKNPGYVQTVQISDTGDISLLYESSSFNDKCADPWISKITDELFVVSYIDDTGKEELALKTFFINDSYQITETGFEEIYSDRCDDPVLFTISEHVVGVTFSNNSNTGVVRTYVIDSDGNITFTGNEVTFEEDTCYDPDVRCLYEDVYAIAYEGPNGHIGRLAKIKILTDGTIEKIISVETFDSNTGITPNIFQISRHIFGIVYQEKSHQNKQPGGLATFSFFNDIDYPYQNAGIYRENIFSLFANLTTVTGGINNQSVTATLNPGWNHIALTYNQSTIALYVNGSLQPGSSKAYSMPLQTNTKPLYIGDYFYGIMDEVALFDHCLTADEVMTHKTQPGHFQ